MGPDPGQLGLEVLKVYLKTFHLMEILAHTHRLGVGFFGNMAGGKKVIRCKKIKLPGRLGDVKKNEV